jgi:hypothetical protein
MAKEREAQLLSEKAALARSAANFLEELEHDADYIFGEAARRFFVLFEEFTRESDAKVTLEDGKAAPGAE